MAKKYKCIADYQGGTWCLDEIDTIEGWRERAIEWADSDGSEGLIKELQELKKSDVIDYIIEVWQIGFKEVND